MKKIRTLLTIGIQFLIVFWYLAFRKKKEGPPKNVLIVQMAKLGDMVCTTPMFRAVKIKYPGCKLTVLGSAINKEVLQGNPYVDAYLVKKGSFMHMAKLLRNTHFDVACITVPSFELLALCIVAQISCIVAPRIKAGWSPYETRSYRLLTHFVQTVSHSMGSYAPREYLRLLEPINIYTSDTKKEIYFSGESRMRVERFLSKQNIVKESVSEFIGILPGAGNEIKSWAPEKFAQLMNIIVEHNPNTTFILLGTDKDTDRAKIILNALNGSVQVINGIGKFSVDELKACVSMLSMVIGADTGPQYIAEALSIPTIDIVGPVDEREQPPIGDIHKIVKVDRKKPELYVLNARVYNKKEALRQIHDISPDMVYKEFEKLMSVLHT